MRRARGRDETYLVGDTPYLHLGSGKGKGRRYRRSDVLAVIQGRFVDPKPKKKPTSRGGVLEFAEEGTEGEIEGMRNEKNIL